MRARGGRYQAKASVAICTRMGARGEAIRTRSRAQGGRSEARAVRTPTPRARAQGGTS